MHKLQCALPRAAYYRQGSKMRSAGVFSGDLQQRGCVWTLQVGAKIVKAGPDNGTVYMKGMGTMYKEHEILVEVNNDGSGVMCACPALCCAHQMTGLYRS